MQDLIDKLRSLGVEIQKATDIRQSESGPAKLGAVLDGEWIWGNDQKIFRISKQIPYGHMVGRQKLDEIKPSAHIHQLFELSENPWHGYGEFVFVDTETSSLSIGAGSFVFLIGLCFFTPSGLRVEQIFLPDVSHEALFLNYFDNRLNGFTTIVTYNGKSFDIPILRSRFTINRIPYSFDDLVHLDLLHTARKIWKLRLESRKLGDIENHILGVKRTNEEIPGWLVPQMYFDYLESGNAELLEGVFYHNEMDIISLALLFGLINNFASDNFGHLREENSLDILSIGEIIRRGKNFELAEKVFELGYEKDSHENIPPELIRKYADVLKRNGNWERAIALWKIATNSGDYLSCIALAKYYEHTAKACNEAFVWSKKGLDLYQLIGTSKKQIRSIEHRIERIQRKLKNEG